MDEVTVPISWVRTHQASGDALTMDPVYMRESDPAPNGLQANKSPATVAVYLLQLYPVTQGCMTQPCVAGTPVTLTAPIMSQVPLQITTTSASNTAFITSSQQVQDCKHNVKLEPLCIVTEQPPEVKTEPFDPSMGAPGASSGSMEWKGPWKQEREERHTPLTPHPHATSPPTHYQNGTALSEDYPQRAESSQPHPQMSPQAFATIPNGIATSISNSIATSISNSIATSIANGVSTSIAERVSLAQSLQSEVTGHTIITTAKFQPPADTRVVNSSTHRQPHHHHNHHGQHNSQQQHQPPQHHQQHHQPQQLPQAGDKPYSCNVCGKSFARAHNLKSHSQTHSGELPFSCKICRKSYSQEAYFRIHSELLNGGRPYACDICRKLFCNSRSFNFHVRSHSRRKYNVRCSASVRCSACGEDFPSCKAYKEHAAIHHNHQAAVHPSQPSQPVTLHLQEKASL